MANVHLYHSHANMKAVKKEASVLNSERIIKFESSKKIFCMDRQKYSFQKALRILILTSTLLISLYSQANHYNDHFTQEMISNDEILHLEKPSIQYQPTKVSEYNTIQIDSTLTYNTPIESKSQPKQWIRITAVPAVFFAAGALSWSAREKYRDTRNRYVSNFHNSFDDYLQHVPAISVYGLNALGIKGKHSVGRATMSFLYGQIIMATTVTILKNTTHVSRPDDDDYNSFPSGHTATAFSGATFLHKEYGQYRNPMYSVFGYSMAAATGIGRQLNNRHWISDVLVGAGIGILSTEVGYVIADKLHGDWGINEPMYKDGYSTYFHAPSFLEVKLGTAWSIEHELSNDTQLDLKPGFVTSFEGAYFFNRYIGVGGEISFSSFTFATGDQLYSNPQATQIMTGIYTEAIGAKGFFAGIYADYPLSSHWSLAAKINPGYAKGVKGAVWLEVMPEYESKFGQKLLVEEYKTGGSFALTGGISLRRSISKTVSARVYVDYGYSKPSWNEATIENLDIENGTYTFSNFKKINDIEASFLSAGLGLTAIIW